MPPFEPSTEQDAGIQCWTGKDSLYSHGWSILESRKLRVDEAREYASFTPHFSPVPTPRGGRRDQACERGGHCGRWQEWMEPCWSLLETGFLRQWGTWTPALPSCLYFPPLLPLPTLGHSLLGLKATQAWTLMGLFLGHERSLQALDVSCGRCKSPSPTLLLRVLREEAPWGGSDSQVQLSL